MRRPSLSRQTSDHAFSCHWSRVSDGFRMAGPLAFVNDSWPFRTTIPGRARYIPRQLSSTLRHLVLNNANDDHEDGAANTTTTNVGEDTLHIHSSASGRSRTHNRLQDRATDAATDDPGD